MTTDQQKLRAFESQIRPWQSQLSSGHRPVQENWYATIEQTRVVHAWEESIIDGMLQTADYARHIFLRYAEMRSSPRDTDAAVHARLKRQAMLHQPGRKFHILMWEAALHSLICPPAVLAAQLDHLASVMDVDSLELGVVPLRAPLKIPAANSFLILDNRVAVTEDWHAELWLDDADTIATYLKVWNTLQESAVYGTEAQSIINRARRSVSSS
ncbi:DUF5753 domain-containing protein [Streptomyces platensis]|uniref:DUF5753 domain-containing protein n=1 Tax=Streptomyces platensis TaxID=58346 RepID=UPI002ED2B997|nr:DUF5753 domain-containing protein [Streptomyces platensis]